MLVCEVQLATKNTVLLLLLLQVEFLERFAIGHNRVTSNVTR